MKLQLITCTVDKGEFKAGSYYQAIVTTGRDYKIAEVYEIDECFGRVFIGSLTTNEFKE